MLEQLLGRLSHGLSPLLAQAAPAAAPTPATSVAPDPGEAAAQSISLIDYIHAGGVVSYILILISFVAVFLVVRNLLVLRYAVLVPPEQEAALDSMLRDGRLDEAAAYCAQAAPRSFLTRTLQPALERSAGSPFGYLEFRGALEESAQNEADEVHRFNDGLGIIAAVGPMLGLLGTVFGMIGAFRSIGALEGAARSTQLSIYMSMALVTTAQGLIVAVPCTIAFALFRRHIDRVLMRAGLVLERAARAMTPATPGAGGPAQRPPAPRPPARQPAPRGVGA
ncbi:MAG: MotA/TolQ/ExbB proton channel family protein [Phycisphaerales bacterium]|nr:MotA/TolQ/ExbB proton channel family protein [Phycisphaerales bacterium]